MLLSNGLTVYDAVTLVSNRMMTRMAQTQLYADSLQVLTLLENSAAGSRVSALPSLLNLFLCL